MDNSHNNLESLASGLGLGLIGRFLGRFISVLGGVLVARFLGPTVFGLYSIGVAITRIVEVAFPLGFDVGAIKFNAGIYKQKYGEFKGIAIVSMVFPFILGAIIGLLLYLLAPWLSMVFFKKQELTIILRFVSFSFPFLGILAVAASITRITQNILYSVLAQDLGQPVIDLVFILLLFRMGFGLYGVLLSDCLSYVLGTIAAIYFVWHLFPDLFNPKISWQPPRKEYYVFSIASSLTAMLSTLMFWTDRVMVGYFLSAIDVGVYQAASQISVVFAVILSGLNRILTPLFASLQNGKLYSELEEVYRIGTKWAFYLGAPIIILLVSSPSDVLRILYGNEYAAGSAILMILLVGQIINLMTGSVAPLLVVGGFQNLTFLYSGLFLILNILLNLYLIPRIGVIGSAIAASVSVGLLYIVLLITAKIKMMAWPYDKRILKGFGSITVSVVSTFFIKTVINTHTAIGLFVQFTGSVLIFVSMLYLTKFDPEDDALILVIKKALLQVFSK